MKPINIFYKEPDPDRWFKYDHFPRKMVRRIVRGKQRPGGVGMVAINLIKGLEKLGIPYRLNDFKYIEKHPDEIACIIGKPNVLFDREWENPVLLGAGIFSHPVECPDLLVKYPNVKRILVPGEWMREMFEPYYHEKVLEWAVGIDTEKWSPGIKEESQVDFLIYDKIRWEHDKYQAELINPICRILKEHGLSFQFIKYGNYSEGELKEKLKHAKSVLFLCEHETQGQAYQQILATNTPILAWDRGGYWQDPYYYPKIKYGPVSSVPYWDDRCGMKFMGAGDFEVDLNNFLSNYKNFNPRAYIEENLTLEKCAENYLTIYQELEYELHIP